MCCYGALEGCREKLGSFTEIIMNPKNIIFVSIASYWEISIKKSLGRLCVQADIVSSVKESGFLWLKYSFQTYRLSGTTSNDK